MLFLLLYRGLPAGLRLVQARTVLGRILVGLGRKRGGLSRLYVH
jgi:hypothetical protein